MGREVGDTEETHGHGAGQAEDHPGHGDAAGVRDGLDRVGSHEARQDVRLAEVAQAPGEQRDHADEGSALEHVDVGRVLHLDGHEGGIHATGGDHHDDRGEDQGEDHQAGLDGVGPAHGEEAADEGVADGRRGTGPQGGFVGDAEGALEQAGTGNDAGSAVDGEEHQDHHGGEDAQDAAVVFEAVGEVVRQGQGVAVVLGLHAQTAGDQQPVEVGANDQANGDPAFGETGEVDGTRQAHQQPAAHVGGAGGQRGNEAAEAAATQDVVGKVVGGAIGCEADQHHGRDIDHEGDQHRVAHTHGGLPCSFVFIRGRRVVRSRGWYLAGARGSYRFDPRPRRRQGRTILVEQSLQGIRPCRCDRGPGPGRLSPPCESVIFPGYPAKSRGSRGRRESRAPMGRRRHRKRRRQCGPAWIHPARRDLLPTSRPPLCGNISIGSSTTSRARKNASRSGTPEASAEFRDMAPRFSCRIL
ncbi:hypothetical protein D3C84_385840 [compost metagenome]